MVSSIQTIQGKSFEVMPYGSVRTMDDAVPGTAPTVSAPVASPATIVQGQCATLTWTSTSSVASYDYVQNAPYTGAKTTTVCPPYSTSYTARSVNSTGTTVSGAATVNVLVPKFKGGLPKGNAVKR